MEKNRKTFDKKKYCLMRVAVHEICKSIIQKLVDHLNFSFG